MSACFNPRPPLPGGDASCPSAARTCRSCFNPRPPLPGGDACKIFWVGGQYPERFNPRPPLPGGDAPSPIVCGRRTAVSIHAPRCRGAMRHRRDGDRRQQAVSIHAPRCRGAMRPGPGRRSLPGNCFNPRPPLPGGDAHAEGDLTQEVSEVSIHAPRCRGAMPAAIVGKHGWTGWFQSTPPVAGGRCPGKSSRCVHR